MTNVIVAFSRPEDARSVKNLLVKNGYHVIAACVSGASVLSLADDLDGGIIVCSYKLNDMIFHALYNSLPPGFKMLLVSSPERWNMEIPEDIYKLALPLKVHDLLEMVEDICEDIVRQNKKRHSKPRQRSAEEMAVIDEAKRLLMERNRMTEEEAHRYMLKVSMDTGTSLLDTAGKLMSLIGKSKK